MLRHVLLIIGVLCVITPPITASADECSEGYENRTFIVGATGHVFERCLPDESVDSGVGGYLGDPNACPVDIERLAGLIFECVPSDPRPPTERCRPKDHSTVDFVLYEREDFYTNLAIVVVGWGWTHGWGSVEAYAYHPDWQCPDPQLDEGYVYSLPDPASARACAARLFAFMQNELRYDCGNFPDFEPGPGP